MMQCHDQSYDIVAVPEVGEVMDKGKFVLLCLMVHFEFYLAGQAMV